MKVTINYDFFDAIKDANEPMHPLKLIRNKKIKYSLLFPLIITASQIIKYVFNADLGYRYWLMYILYMYGFNFGVDLVAEFIARKITNEERDLYAVRSIERLKQLSVLLKKINVNTDYDMLLESELYSKENELIKDERLLPSLMEKNILVYHPIMILEK